MNRFLLGIVCIFSLVSVTFAMQGDTLVLKGDKQFTISLAANPTTGYQWVVKQYDKSVLKLLSSHYDAAKSKLIGSGGNMTFVFAVKAPKHMPKSTLITLSYQRPWEANQGNSKVIKVKFK